MCPPYKDYYDRFCHREETVDELAERARQGKILAGEHSSDPERQNIIDSSRRRFFGFDL